MLNPRSKRIYHSLSITLYDNYMKSSSLISQFSHRYHTSHFRWSSPKPRHQRPPKSGGRRLCQPIPFLNTIKEAQTSDEALSLFHDSHQTGYKHYYPSYSALIYKLARSRNFEAVKTILNYLQHYNVRCSERLFTALIQHYGKAQLPDEAIKLFRSMHSYNCERTLQSFNTLLNVLIDNGRFDDAKEMFEGSSRMGFRLNSVSFNVMIKGWLGKGDWGKACQVFDEMLDREVEPTVVTYNSRIGFLCRRGEFDKAKELFNEMAKKGKRPNAVTYALLMEGLCSLGKYKEAKKMMFDMEYQGCKTRVVNYGVLMSDLGKRGNIDEAKSLLNEMKKRWLKPDVVMYNILLNNLCKLGRVSEAYTFLVGMHVQGCQPNAATYRMMVDEFCQARDFEGGLKVLNAMLTSKHCPRFETFCALITGLVNCGKLDDACFVLEEMEKRKLGLHLVPWEALVWNTCLRSESAETLMSELVAPH